MMQIQLDAHRECCCCFLSQPHLTSSVAQVKVPHHDPEDAHYTESPPHVLLSESGISCNLQSAHSEHSGFTAIFVRVIPLGVHLFLNTHSHPAPTLRLAPWLL
ncbi:hypothetical protein AMECASPLE_039151 [Ameca splendens]|uniref:Uncharacterized protein n=1 Tax=Ameca splendens TaxID=208324 RepID=A0ABV0XXQ4_9TELE